MDFSWSPEQRELYDRVLRFSQGLTPTPEGPPRLDREVWRRLGEFGLLSLPVPSSLGGLGLDMVTTALAMEAFGRGCSNAGLVFSAAAHLFACVVPIWRFGSSEQHAHTLSKLCSGEWIAANAITEAEAGSDAHALRTRAQRDGDGYLLEGAKSYVTNGPDADVLVAYATVNPKFGYLGVTGFLVPARAEGVRIGKPFEKMGLKSSPISQVYFEGCRVPESARLGAEGSGAAIFRNSMAWERACLFATYVGVMDRTLERCVEFARTRKQFGRAIGKNQGISHRLANAKLRLESARLLLYRACWLSDQQRDATMDIAMAKVAISEAAVLTALDAVQIHGGMGFIVESGIEHLVRDAIPTTLFSGTSEIQRDIIAAKLGL